MPKADRGRGIVLAAVGAAATLILAILIAGALEPGYSHARQYVSELGAVGSAHPRVLNLGGLVPSGLLTVLFSIGLYRRVRPSGWLVASSMLAGVAGVGRWVAGLAPCDAGCAMDQMSVTARIHAGAGFTSIMAGSFAALAMAVGLRRIPERPLFRISLGLGALSFGLAVALFGLGKDAAFIGVIQRLYLALFFAWIIAVGLGIDSLETRSTSTAEGG